MYVQQLNNLYLCTNCTCMYTVETVYHVPSTLASTAVQ